MRAERNEEPKKTVFSHICKKGIFSIAMKSQQKVDECKRRPEFKSFFHKSSHKTDYSIIPQCHVRMNK